MGNACRSSKSIQVDSKLPVCSVTEPSLELPSDEVIANGGNRKGAESDLSVLPIARTTPPPTENGTLGPKGSFDNANNNNIIKPETELGHHVNGYANETSENDETNKQRLAELLPSTGPYSIVYFATIRNRAEVSKLVLAYARISFSNKDVTFQDWPKLKPLMPFGQLPVLVNADGKILSQSFAIARYLAREYGFTGNNNLESAKADMLMDGLKDVMEAFEKVALAKDEDSKKDMFKEFQREKLNVFLERYEKILSKSSTAFFLSDSVCWADLGIGDYLANLQENWDNECLDSYPKLEKLVTAVRALPELQRYYEQRPASMAKL